MARIKGRRSAGCWKHEWQPHSQRLPKADKHASINPCNHARSSSIPWPLHQTMIRHVLSVMFYCTISRSLITVSIDVVHGCAFLIRI